VSNLWKGRTGNLSQPNGTFELSEGAAQANLSSTVKGTYGILGIEEPFLRSRDRFRSKKRIDADQGERLFDRRLGGKIGWICAAGNGDRLLVSRGRDLFWLLHFL